VALQPDWRLGQIIVNASTADPFYVEDDVMRDGLTALAAPYSIETEDAR
jgi:hypothetical protein